MGWIILIAIIVAVVLALKPKQHRHYCDTCKHGIWNRGRCFCEVYNNHMNSSEISRNAGCKRWVSRR